MAAVGFTTGSLYRSGLSLNDRIKLYLSAGADAIELGFSTPNELLAYELTEAAARAIKQFKHISIHAPSKEVRYGSNSDTRKIIEKLKFLCSRLLITGIVVHPDAIDDFELLEQSGLPFLLENMDKRKAYGTHPEHFRELKEKYNFGFVLDAEHAYEHDPSMQLAREFIEVMGGRLKHMHVSGCSQSEIHVPTFRAVNKRAITEILKMGLNVPKILEGALLEEIQNSITRELEFVRSYERK